MPRRPIKKEDRPQFAAWLIEKREERGLNQTDLAIKSGLSSAHVSKIEAGKTRASKKTIRSLVYGIAPEGVEVQAAEDLLDEAMIAAGYQPLVSLTGDEWYLVKAFRKASIPMKRAALAVLHTATDSDQEMVVFQKTEQIGHVIDIGKQSE